MIILQFIFYFAANKFFDVPDRIMYNTFFIYLILNFTKNMYSFKTILIWEELKKQIQVHTNKFFDVPDRIMYNTFFIYLILNFTKNMYSFKTILIWEELKKQIQVHTEFLLVMLVNDIAFWDNKYILEIF